MKMKEIASLDKSKLMIIDRWIINTKPKVASIQVENYGLSPVGAKPVVYKFKEFVPDMLSSTLIFDMLKYYMCNNPNLFPITNPVNKSVWDTDEQEEFCPLEGPYMDFVMKKTTHNGIYDVQSNHCEFDGDIFGNTPSIGYSYLSGHTDTTETTNTYYSTEMGFIIFNGREKKATVNILNKYASFTMDILDLNNIKCHGADIRHYGDLIEQNNGNKIEVGDDFFYWPFIFTSEGFVFSNDDYVAIRKVEQCGNVRVVTNAIYG